MEQIKFSDRRCTQYNFTVKDNRVYSQDGAIVRIGGISHGPSMICVWGEFLPEGTPDEKTRIHNWLMYDPFLIKKMCEMYDEELTWSEIASEMKDLVQEGVGYDSFFSGMETSKMWLVCDGVVI